MTITPLRSRTKALHKITTPKQSLFCPDLQILLRPIVELTQKEPVLHLPKADGRFILYSNTSKEGTGSSVADSGKQAKTIGLCQ